MQVVTLILMHKFENQKYNQVKYHGFSLIFQNLHIYITSI